MAMKCIEKDPAFFPEEALSGDELLTGTSDSDVDDEMDGSPTLDSMDGSPTLDSSEGDISAIEDIEPVKVDAKLAFKPYKACADPFVAKLIIENYAFNIECGCEEKKSYNCSIATGMKVQWLFFDGEEHNVAGKFGKSGDQLSGTWTQEFKVPGSYKYDCSIHWEDMSGYKIIVK
jgi:hypothetical protein